MWMVTFEYAAETINGIEYKPYTNHMPCFFLTDVTTLLDRRYNTKMRKPAKVTIEYREEVVTSETYKKSAISKISRLCVNGE